MATVLFVHGISIRQRNFNRSFEQIESRLKAEPSWEVAPCVWGDKYGAELKAGGKSIPARAVAKGFDSLPADEEIGQWQALYSDPLCELRLWSLRPVNLEPFDPLGRKTSRQLLDERIQTLNISAELATTLGRCGISGDQFHAARQAVIGAPQYVEALNGTPLDELGDFAWALARAIVSTTITNAVPQAVTTKLDDITVVPADARDELVVQLVNELAVQGKGLVSSWLTRAVSSIGTRYLTGSRALFCSAVVPYVGDILLYQSCGTPIRELIRSRIANCRPPIVVLAHSLGGVACVELLAAEALPEVELLVTVGSQAPFFYEMDALGGLRYGERLPDHFPRWLNIYDCCDFLSFVGASVFPDYEGLEDIEVNNRQPFPWSHTSYWSNSQTWDAILPRLPRGKS